MAFGETIEESTRINSVVVASNAALDRYLDPVIKRMTNDTHTFMNLYLQYRMFKRYAKETQSDNSRYTIVDHLWKIYPTTLDRASALVGHISIMFSLSAILLAVIVQAGERSGLLTFFAMADLFVKTFLMLLSLRSLRTFGTYKRYKSVLEYRRGLLREMANRHSLIMLINTLSGIGVVMSLGLIMATIIVIA